MPLLPQVCSRKVAETVLGKEAVSAIITATARKIPSVRGKAETLDSASGGGAANAAVSMSHLRGSRATVETRINSESSEVNSRILDKSSSAA